MIALRSMKYGLVISLFIFSLVLPSLTVAQETTASPSPRLTPSPMPKVSYTLPYPGMLPDSPLYPLKMMRDNVILFLITDPFKKAEFNLLQADKRLQSGIFLLQKDKSKVELALSTIAKGENYAHQAIQMTSQLKNEDHDLGAFLGDLELSTKKHEEVLTNLKKTLPDQRQEIDRLLRQVVSHQQAIAALIEE